MFGPTALDKYLHLKICALYRVLLSADDSSCRVSKAKFHPPIKPVYFTPLLQEKLM